MAILLYELVGADHARPFSPHCWKAAMALAHKGLAFERVPTPFTAVATVEAGQGRTVPVIRDGATVVQDSFAIAEYLEDAHPDRPSLFGGPGGRAAARFVERWTQLVIHSCLGPALLMDVHDRLAPVDGAHFRRSREARYGRALEEVAAGREERLAALRSALEPLRATLALQPFLGGDGPLFADYVVFGAFQWARVVSPFPVLAGDDPLHVWFGRCLDLHGGLGRATPAAA